MASEKEFSRPTNCIVCPGHTRPIPDIAYSLPTSDGTFLVSSCLDGKPQIRVAETGDWIGTFEGHRGAVWKTRLNAAADRALTASADFSVKLWDACAGTELHSFVHKHIVKTADFSADGAVAVTGGHEKILRLFDLQAPQAEPIATLAGHNKPIVHAFFSRGDSALIYSSGEEANVRIWDRRTLTQIAELPTTSEVKTMELSPDGTLLTVAAGKEVMFFDLAQRTLVASHTLARPLKCAALHPARTQFAAASDQELWIRLYDFTTGAEIDCQKGHHGPVNSVAFAPSGNGVYATGSVDGTIRLWEALPAADAAPPPLAL